VLPVRYEHNLHIKSKALPVTGRGGPQLSETSRLLRFLESWLTDGGEVVSHMPWSTLPQEDSC
jgi:hypothetical protein